jgi:hypothetical protein
MDPRRREEIAAAVEAWNQDHPTARLPRRAAQLLAVMFAEADVCQLSHQDLAARGFGGALPKTLRALVAAGFMSRQAGAGSVPDTYRLQLEDRP